MPVKSLRLYLSFSVFQRSRKKIFDLDKKIKIVIFMRGGMLSFSILTRDKNEEEKNQIQNTQNRSLKICPDG